MDDWLDGLSQALGLQGTLLLLILVVVSQLCRLVAKLIPDDSVGWRHWVRITCAWIGLYVNNRISRGVTTPQAIHDVGRLAKAANTKANSAVDQLDNATILTRGPGGKFQKLESPWFVGILAVFLALLSTGCATKGYARVQTAVTAICTSAPVAQAAIDGLRVSHVPGVVDKALDFLTLNCPLIRLAIR